MSNSKEYTQEEINERYSNRLIQLMEGFSLALNQENKITGLKQGYVMLMIRDPSEGNVDIASNLTTASLIPILEFALESARDDLKTKGE